MNIETSYNFRKIHDDLTTSGVVRPDCLKTLASQGYEVLVNLMPDASEYAVADERAIVKSQKLEYIYIPVDFKQPKHSDFVQFSEALDRVLDKKVHIHCAANYRVSAFYALYAANRGYWSPDRAWKFILEVWQPAEHSGWSEFIADVGTIQRVTRKENSMIKVLPESKANILVLSAMGKLTDKDYKDVLIPRIELIIREHGNARLLLDMGDEFHGWDAAALWDDAHFGLTHRNDFEKMGVIGGPKWVEWGLKIAALAISGEIRSFSSIEREEALRWINA